MIRILSIVAIILLFFYLPLSSQQSKINSNSIANDSKTSIVFDLEFNNDTILSPFNKQEQIDGLFANAIISLFSEKSLVRLILVDTENTEYLIYESFSLLEDSNIVKAFDIAEETGYLNHNVIPIQIKIQIVDASVRL